MFYVFTKCGQEFKGKVGLFAKGTSKHHAVWSWKGRFMTFGIKAWVLKGQIKWSYFGDMTCHWHIRVVKGVSILNFMRKQEVGVP